MTLRRAFSTLGCPSATWDEVVALGRLWGWSLELRTLEGTTDLPELLARRFGTPAAWAEAVRRSGVAVVAFGTSVRLGEAGDADGSELSRWVPWAEAAGVRWLRVFDGAAGVPGEGEDRAIAGWRAWQERRVRGGWGVEIMVETHDSLFTAAALQRWRERAGPVPVLWDSHHTWKRGGEDPLRTWSAVRQAVVHIHVKDSTSVPSARHPFTYVRPGEGEFPARSLLARLEADGFHGAVSLEWEKQWHPYLPELPAAWAAGAEAGWWPPG